MPQRRVLEVEKRPEGVAIVRMDVPDAPVNVLRGVDLEAFDQVFDELERDDAVRAVVFASGKPDGFLAGADLEALLRCRDPAQATSLARSAQRLVGRVDELPKPIVAAIHGACLGPGLELAAACDGRVASDDRATRLGQPEIRLGLMPGAGGTQRLPRLLGVQRALDLLLTGRSLRAHEALDVALVDEVVPAPILVDVAAEHALRLASTPPHRETFRERLARLFSREELESLALADNPVGRRVVFDQARRRVLGRTHGHALAQERVLEAVRTGLERGLEAGLDAEAKGFGEVVTSLPSVEQMRLFLSRREIDRAPLPDEPRPVRQVGVVGAGLMGGGVAFVTAEVARLQVRLKDRDDDRVADALRRVRALMQQDHDRGRLGALELERRWHRVTATTDWRGFERCDLVVESVYEDVELKRLVLREVEAVGREDLVFASTTSAVPVAALAEASRHPENVVGMHYFSPVPRIPLLEVVAGPATSPRAVATAVSLGRQQGKTVIVVRDGPGFYTTRILAPMLSEAGHLVSEGVPIAVVDAALQDFGFPVGPFRLLDEIGIDVSAKVNALLAEAHGDRMAPWAGLRWLVDDRRYGRKNQRGFYRWAGGTRGEVDASVYAILGVTPRADTVPSEDLAWRCVLRLVNEAVHCHGEGVLRATRDGDVGAVLALGFPAFHGGPFRLVDAVGPREILERLQALRERYGARFEPSPLLAELARTDATFYGEDAPAPGALPTRKAR